MYRGSVSCLSCRTGSVNAADGTQVYPYIENAQKLVCSWSASKPVFVRFGPQDTCRHLEPNGLQRNESITSIHEPLCMHRPLIRRLYCCAAFAQQTLLEAYRIPNEATRRIFKIVSEKTIKCCTCGRVVGSHMSGPDHQIGFEIPLFWLWLTAHAKKT